MSQKAQGKPGEETHMKRIKEFQTAFVRISLLAEAMQNQEKARWYIREIGLTAKNEHDTMQTFHTRKEAEAEYKRLQELLRENGNAIMETIYKEPINA